MSEYKVKVISPDGSGYGQPIMSDSDADALEQMRKNYAPGLFPGELCILARPDGTVMGEFWRSREKLA